MSNFNYQNNIFFNNNSNDQSQMLPHENLFNKKITDYPEFNFNNQNNNNNNNNYYNYNYNNYNKINNIYNDKRDMYNDYEKQYKEQNYKQMQINQSRLRFNQNYGNKIKNSQKSGINLNENGDVFIDEYIKKIKELYKDSNNYEEFKQGRGYYNFSRCPFCKGPAFYEFERVTCINKCFMTSVCKNTFDQNYTLDNFIEQYQDYYSKHQNCDRNLLTLYVDNESKCAEFLCYKCEKEYINF